LMPLTCASNLLSSNSESLTFCANSACLMTSFCSYISSSCYLSRRCWGR
jgi:hypothetical protein